MNVSRDMNLVLSYSDVSFSNPQHGDVEDQVNYVQSNEKRFMFYQV